jgi:hypothetical protein
MSGARLAWAAFLAALASTRALAAGMAADAQADTEHAPRAEERPFKATVGYYSQTGGDIGIDVNLRHSSILGNLWAGYFDSHDLDTHQGRVGWDRAFVFDPVRLLPSVQWASGGFLGGAIVGEIGLPWFVSAGIGRTNEKPYVNLNFDPNDAYLVAAGRRGEDGTLVMAQWIVGERINSGQKVGHLIYRRPVGGADRLTLDVSYKDGPVDDVTIHKLGVSVGYDWDRWFGRVAYDPKVNFTPADMWRFSVGLRF